MPNPMEEMASKGMGKAKKAKAAIKGLKGVFAKLAEEHGEVSVLLERGKRASDPEKRTELWQKIRAELLSHERAETSKVYSVLHQRPETESLASHHDEEAEELEELIARVDAANVSGDEWAEAFEELADTVEHHAGEEEEEIFPKAMKVLDDRETEQLEREFLSEKKRVLQAVS